MRGLRGSAAGYAAQIWGVPLFKYNHIADLWPLNPKGELIYGVKIEDTFADQQVDGTLALPGLSMAEWGPGDHSYWLYGLDVMPEEASQRAPNIMDMPEMVKVRQKVLDLCKKNNVKFLNAANTDKNSSDYIIKQIQDGAMVLECGEDSAIRVVNSQSGKCRFKRPSRRQPNGCLKLTQKQRRPFAGRLFSHLRKGRRACKCRGIMVPQRRCIRPGNDRTREKWWLNRGREHTGNKARKTTWVWRGRTLDNEE